jgi:hypothetical protein
MPALLTVTLALGPRRATSAALTRGGLLDFPSNPTCPRSIKGQSNTRLECCPCSFEDLYAPRFSYGQPLEIDRERVRDEPLE